MIRHYIQLTHTHTHTHTHTEREIDGKWREKYIKETKEERRKREKERDTTSTTDPRRTLPPACWINCHDTHGSNYFGVFTSLCTHSHTRTPRHTHTHTLVYTMTTTTADYFVYETARIRISLTISSRESKLFGMMRGQGCISSYFHVIFFSSSKCVHVTCKSDI